MPLAQGILGFAKSGGEGGILYQRFRYSPHPP